VTDDEWAFVAPYLTLMTEDAPQRTHDLREVFNGMRFIVRTGNQWRFMPHDLLPWPAVYQQIRRWVVERSFAWTGRFRRLAREYERLQTALEGFHYVAFTLLPLKVALPIVALT
jgi:transposase